ncbi:putative glycoside hydrolase-like family 5 (GHL5) protein [Palleronia aestuarii]|uniref:Putative glycoside hydrolase-like family 5 (GHL5) protein n=1 Tax=Palleronia aestuarii TaxID=568105 RepID=A0A2W7P265_9RHOB|nr:glucosylglycerol hydrolase [Palleronia aestuarii]PZX17532.1 putative glycoside hydrolase-like family 5 (GHL5) protein [Palleronia aestuarii]
MGLKDRVAADMNAAEGLANKCRLALTTAPTAFDAHERIARTMGGQYDGELATFGFWTPELLDHRIPDGDVFLEISSPFGPLDLTRSHQEVPFERILLPVARYEAHTFAAATGMRAGNRDAGGDFYALVWRDPQDRWHRILDPLAMSLPFGAFAPAELYDVAAMQANRADAAYFERFAGDAPHKFGPPVNILQIHVPTATAGGSLASLTRQYRRLAERVEKDLPIDPMDEIFLGYDAVQLLPVEPTTVHEQGLDFWSEAPVTDDGQLVIDLVRPDTTNWGYDIVISGMATVNPVLLESGRPDELIDFAAALHNFPGKPKMLILDVVFGHADNQGLKALNHHFFAGPNMYGQNLDYRNPAVRAILLEMQRRKVDFGADGVRVDGAQDFKWWDPGEQKLKHDDDYLQCMSDIVQEVAGVQYRPWFVFEDGRPWPQEDWELSSTYRAVIETQTDDDVFQWGPLTFAHNTPFIYGYWLSKWWRIREMLSRGSNWISGTANHDTLRRGTQVNPKLNINTRLGDTQKEILEKAYDNPAVSVLTYGAFPGVPMDFLNATARANWGFIRNQDDRYGVKVVAEEAISLKWQVDSYSYSVPGNFRRLKELGFETRSDLARFFEFLPALVDVTEYDLDHIAKLLNGVEPPLAGPGYFTIGDLKRIARAWMDDMHEYCNVSNSVSALHSAQTNFMLRLRRFRRANSWLRDNLGPDDHFDYLQPVDGRTIFTCYRKGPSSEIFTITHMEGGESDPFDPLSLPIPGLEGDGWRCILRTPPIGSDYEGGEIVLRDSMGLVFERG